MSDGGSEPGKDDWWAAGEQHSPPPGTPGLAPSNPFPQSGGFEARRFYDLITQIGFVIFSAILLTIDVKLIGQATKVRGPAAAAFMVTLILGIGLYGLLRAPYVAVVSSDGTLTFKSLTSSTTTNVANIQRVRLARGRGGTTWVFYFDDTQKSLGHFGGRSLARYLSDRNPAIRNS